MLMWRYTYLLNMGKNMICSKCSLEKIRKEKKEAMKRFTEKLKRENYEKKRNTPKDKV